MGFGVGQYHFDILYRPGVKNTDADAMSRYPTERSEESIKIEDQTVKAICSSIAYPPSIEILPCMGIDIIEATEMPGQPMAQLEVREIRQSQRQDPIIGNWVRAVIDRTLPNKTSFHSRDDNNMRKNFSSLKMIRGILYREVRHREETINQLVLPECFRGRVFQGLHDDVGHHGRDRTLSLLRERFFWPGMAADVDAYQSAADA